MSGLSGPQPAHPSLWLRPKLLCKCKAALSNIPMRHGSICSAAIGAAQKPMHNRDGTTPCFCKRGRMCQKPSESLGAKSYGTTSIPHRPGSRPTQRPLPRSFTRRHARTDASLLPGMLTIGALWCANAASVAAPGNERATLAPVPTLQDRQQMSLNLPSQKQILTYPPLSTT